MAEQIDITYCVVSMDQRELLKRCLDSIAAEVTVLKLSCEVLVLDNCSQDGSVKLAQDHPVKCRVIALGERHGKAENDSQLLKEARGKYCFLLNDDSEILSGATLALWQALEDDNQAAAAGSIILDPKQVQQPSAWRFPTVASSLAALFALHKRFVVQSKGTGICQVDWAQSAALLVRREMAAAVNYLDKGFFVYSDEVDFCKRLSDRGWHTLYVPTARVIHHEQLSHGSLPRRRIVEFSRNRDRYMRKHHGRVAAFAVRLITALTYLTRAAVAVILPGHSPSRYLAHASATLQPNRGEGIREAAEQFNRELNVI